MRYEIKFPYKNFYNNELLTFLNSTKNIKQNFPKRKITSIYFDDLNLTTAIENVQGVSKRRKYRVRFYNDDMNNLFHEIKIKNNSLGIKRIIKTKNNFMDLNNFFSYQFLNSKFENYLPFFKEVKHHNLKPVCKISYYRNYFLYKNKIRITHDHSILYYSLLYKHDNSLNYIKDENEVLEVKFEIENLPIASEILNKINFQNQRYSKYLSCLSNYKIISYF